MTFLDTIRNLFKPSAVAVSVVPEGMRCVAYDGFRKRHLFLGEKVCSRVGCFAESPYWKPRDLLQEAREIAAELPDESEYAVPTERPALP